MKKLKGIINNKRIRRTNLIFSHQVREAGNFIGERSNHIDGRGKKIVELLRLFCLCDGWVARTGLPVLRVIQGCLIGCRVQVCADQSCDQGDRRARW